MGYEKWGVLKGAESRSAGASDRANAYMGNLSDRDHGSNRGSSADDDVREISSAVTGLAMVFATRLEGTEGLQLSDEALPADERLELEQMKSRVRAAIEKLPEKERKLLQGYYFQAKTLEEAGAEIGQSKSWASRLHARAVERLKEILDQEESANGRTTRRNLSGPDSFAEAPRSGRPAGQQARTEQVRSGTSSAKGPDQGQAAQASQSAQQVGQAQHVNQAAAVAKTNPVAQSAPVNASEKARLNKIVANAGNEQHSTPTRMDPVAQKTEVSKGTGAISGLFANIEKGQHTMDKLISGAMNGKNFSNTELLSLQAGMYKYSQELDLTSKVVEKATSGLKDTLKTQV